jgi:hypothetical protein
MLLALLPASNSGEPRTFAYRGSTLAGSIQRHVEPPGTSWRLQGAFYSCAGPPGEAALYKVNGVVHLDLEGRTVAGSAHRVSASLWRIFGDPAIGAPRMGMARRVTATRWDVYRWSRRIGHTRGPDGPAAGLALMFC